MTERILIVDDEEHIRRMMRPTLEAAGYSVGEAGAGREGVKLYGDGSSWDLVVLDHLDRDAILVAEHWQD